MYHRQLNSVEVALLCLWQHLSAVTCVTVYLIPCLFASIGSFILILRLKYKWKELDQRAHMLTQIEWRGVSVVLLWGRSPGGEATSPSWWQETVTFAEIGDQALVAFVGGQSFNHWANRTAKFGIFPWLIIMTVVCGKWFIDQFCTIWTGWLMLLTKFRKKKNVMPTCLSWELENQFILPLWVDVPICLFFFAK